MKKVMKEKIYKIKQTFIKFLSFFKKGLIKNASQLISGTVAAQSIVILTAPIITRIYTPEDLGYLAIFVSITAIIGSLSTLRYEIAIPLAKDYIDSSSLLILTIIVNIIYTFLCSIFLILFSKPLLGLLNAQILLNYLWVIPIGIFLGGLFRSFTYWALKEESFSDVAKTRIQQSSGMVIAQVLFGILNFGAFGLIIGYILGFFSGLIRLIYFWFKTGVSFISKLRLKNIFSMAVVNKDLPLFSNWGAFINVIGLQLPIIMFASLFSPYLAGLYMLAQRVANAPVQLVAESVGKAFYISSIKHKRQQLLLPLVEIVFRALLRISILPFLLLSLIAPSLFSLVFGSEWLEAGIYLQLMIIWLLASFIFVPLMTLFATLDRHREDLIFQSCLVILRIIGIYIGAIFESPVIAIVLFSIFSAITYFTFGSWLLIKSGLRFSRQIKILLEELKIPLLVFLILLVLDIYFFNLQSSLVSISAFLIYILICISLTIFYLFKSKDLLNELRNFSD